MRCTSVLKFVLLFALAGFVNSQTSRADFIDQEILSVFSAPELLPGDNLWDGLGGASIAEPTAAIVSGAIEYEVDMSVAVFFADFGSDTIDIGIENGSGTIGADLQFDFFDFDASPGISNVELLDSGFDGVSVEFTNGVISVSIPDQTYTDPFLSIGVTFVPEPNTFAFAYLMAGLCLVRRKR